MSNDKSLPPDEQRHYKSLYDTFTRTLKEDGVKAFWRGSGPFVSRAMLVGVFQVATLDQFKDFYAINFDQKRNSILNVFCAAMTSGLIYSIATMPLEAAKNRMASQKVDPKTGRLPYTGALQTVTKVTSENGFMSLYNGFFPYYLRCGGHTVSMFIMVQLLRDTFCEYNPQYRAK
jgi:solute carrier family 25 oxoglutarate transporter 11